MKHSLTSVADTLSTNRHAAYPRGWRTLRVLFLAGRDMKHPQAGGGDIQAWEFARYLASRGHTVHYVCSSGAGLPGEEVLAGVQVLRVGAGAMLAVRALSYYLRHRREFDLVYEDVIGGSRPPFLAPLYVHQPIIAAWHQVNGPLLGETHSRPFALFLSLAEKALAKCYRATHVRVPSEERRLEIHSGLGLSLQRLHTIPASVADEWLAIGPGQTEKESTILYLGNIRKYKGIHLLIEALPLILRECPDARVVIAGRRWDVSYETRLSALASQLGIEDRVGFRFNISQEEKKVLLRSTKVLVLPSRLEGFGIVILEANAVGVPVVVSTGVPEDAMKDGINGIRVPYGDVKSLAAAIIRLLRDDQLYQEISANSIAFARQFQLERVGALFEGLALRAVSAGVDRDHAAT